MIDFFEIKGDLADLGHIFDLTSFTRFAVEESRSYFNSIPCPFFLNVVFVLDSFEVDISSYYLIKSYQRGYIVVMERQVESFKIDCFSRAKSRPIFCHSTPTYTSIYVSYDNNGRFGCLSAHF